MKRNDPTINKTLTTLLAVTLLVAFLVPTASAATSTATSGNVAITIDSPTRATATVEQEWDATVAKNLRQSLDVFFGAGDGKLSEGEVDRIARASEDDMRNNSLPFIFFDGAPVRVSSVELSVLGAPGSTTSVEPIRMRHVLALDLTPAAGNEHKITVAPMWNGQLSVQAPSDWAAGTPTGLVPDTGAGVSGAMKTEVSVNIPYVIGGAAAPPPDLGGAGTTTTPPPNVTGETPDENVAEPGKKPASIPAPGVVLGLAAVAIAGLLFEVGRKRR